MKLLLCIALVVLALTKAVSLETKQKPSSSKQGSTEEALIALEKQTWALIKQRDLKAYAGLMADDYYEIFPEGKVYTKEQINRTRKSADFSSSKLSARRLSPGLCYFQ